MENDTQNTIDTDQSVIKKLEKSLSDQLKKAGESLTKWLSPSSGMTFLISKTKEAVSELVTLDSILTEINQTSNLTKKELTDLGDTAFETASKYGKSAGDYLTAVKEMYAAGVQNAKEMAELSLLAQSAGGMDSSSTSAYLLAANEAYGYKCNVEELTKVLDGQNHIAENTALSLEDMAAATSKAASTASECNVEMDELSAMIAAVASDTKQSSTEVANALNSIFTSLQDTTNTAITDVFEAANISMTKMSNGSEVLKTPIELLKELSKVFTDLEKNSALKADISSIGGGTAGDALNNILSDWSAYEDMLGLYSQGMGSAAKSAEENVSNIQSSLNRLSNTWTDTIGNIADSDAMITLTNGFNGFLSVLNSITENLGSFGTISTVASGILGAKGLGLTNCVTSHSLRVPFYKVA